MARWVVVGGCGGLGLCSIQIFKLVSFGELEEFEELLLVCVVLGSNDPDHFVESGSLVALDAGEMNGRSVWMRERCYRHSGYRDR